MPSEGPPEGIGLAMRCRMPKTTSELETPLREQLDRLASLDSTADLPVISLYLDMRADGTGRTNVEPFLRKALAEQREALTGDARASFERDSERIQSYLANDVEKSANGVAIFACHARDGFFEALQLDAPIEQHQLFVGQVPHLYPLAKLNDQFPRYAALLVNTNSARLFVFGLGDTETQQQVVSTKTRRTTMGGWSQARYQRHIENFHLHHMKEVAEVLDRVVREESLTKIVVSCDEVAKPILMDQLPKHLVEKIVDVVSLDMKAPDQQVLAETLDALRQKDAETDAEHVEAAIGAWRASGLGAAGPAGTRAALERGQVEELLITAAPTLLRAGSPEEAERLANELVTLGQQTSARIRFIEDPALLAEVGGVAALLRFRL
jgi:peptide chain release factor subunit 1